MSIKGKLLPLFFQLRPDCEQFYQKEIVKVLKQPNLKSITVSERRLIQYDKKISAACSGGFLIVTRLLFIMHQ